MTPPSTQARTALLVIDMQNSYFDFPELEEQREAVTAKVNELIRAARQGGRPILLIRTQHERDRSTWTVNMQDDDQGFAYPGTEQAEYVAGLDTDGGVGLVKTRDSAFFDTDLAARLRNLGVERRTAVSPRPRSTRSPTTSAPRWPGTRWPPRTRTCPRRCSPSCWTRCARRSSTRTTRCPACAAERRHTPRDAM